MKKSFVLPLLALSLLGFLAGCGHLDLNGPMESDRVLVGVVTARVPTDLPADAEVSVSVLDRSKGEARTEVLGEQTIKGPVSMPVEFRIEFRAEDAQLRSTVDVEARISVGRRLLYMTTSRHPVTLGNVSAEHTVEVEPMSGR